MAEKNTHLQDQVDEYRSECHKLTESLTGIQENFEDSGLNI